jgi:CHAT domain-containing protein
MAVSKVDEAWMVSEKSRSRSFIDSIATQRLDFANPESNSLLESFNEENSKVLSIERLVASASDEQKKSKLTERLKIAKSEADKVLATIENKDKALRQFVKVEAIDKDKIAELIGDETALVEYFVTPEMLHIWTSFQGKLSGTSISVTRTDLTKRVKDFRTLLQNYSTTDYLGAELADLLIYPIKANIQGAKRLAIVPHGELHFLPFSALPIDDEFLVDRFAVFYLDSATEARYLLDKEPRSISGSSSILALSNPTTGSENEPGTLAFADKEVSAMQRYFPKIRRVRGQDASEGLLRKSSGSYDIIHIAAHGEFDEKSPADSLLSLSQDSQNDGNLRVREIFELRLNSRLVTLSACESGVGKVGAADEVVGLHRAFMYAGAESVVSSLWRISDVSSASKPGVE